MVFDVRWVLAFVADVTAFLLNWFVASDLPVFTLFTAPTITALLILGAMRWRWCGWLFVIFEAIAAVVFFARLGLPEFGVGVLYLTATLLAWSVMRSQATRSKAAS